MVAVLVLASFIVFVGVDYYLYYRRPQPVLAKAALEAAKEVPFPLQLVGGFELRANFAYHPGHAWALRESPKLVRVGLDDFAARLLGEIDAVELPARGRWLRQGEKGWYLDRQGPPASLHCTVNAVHDGQVSAFLADLAQSVDEVSGAAGRGERGAYGTVE